MWLILEVLRYLPSSQIKVCHIYLQDWPLSNQVNQCSVGMVMEWNMSRLSKFQIEFTSPSGKWIVKITYLNVPFPCLKNIKPMQLMWKSKIHSHSSDKSCRCSTCPTVIFTRLGRSDHRENSPVTQTTPEPTLLSWGGRPREKKFPHPWPHGKPGLIALIGPLRPYSSQVLWSCSGVSRK